MRLPTFALLLLAAPAFAAPVPGEAAKPLTHLPVPADSRIVMQARGLDPVLARLKAMLKGFGAADAKAYGDAIQAKLLSGLEGRDLQGLDATGRVYAALGDTKNNAGGTPFAMVLPVKDYKTFREKFLTADERKSFEKGKGGVDEFESEGSTMYVVGKDDHVVLTSTQAHAEAYTGKFDRFPVDRMGTLAEGFLAADLSAFVHAEKLAEDYGDDLRQGKALFAQLLQQAGQGVDRRQLELAKTMIEGIFQVAEDAKGLLLAVDLRPAGAALQLAARFKADTPTAAALADEKPTALAGLGTLPKGMTGYTAGRFTPKLARTVRTFSQPFAPGDDADDKSAEAIDAYLDLLTAAPGESRSMGGEGTANLSALATADAAKIDAAMAAVMKALAAGSRYNNVVLKAAPKLDAPATHAGFSLRRAAVELDYEATAKNIPQEELREAAVASMKKLAPEKQSVWFGTDGKSFVQVTAKDWTEAKTLLDAYAAKDGRAADEAAFAVTRAELPKEANYLAMTDTGALVGQIGGFLEGLAGALPALPGVQIPHLHPVKGERAFLGVAFTAQPEYARFDLFVPVAAMKAFRDSFGKDK